MWEFLNEDLSKVSKVKLGGETGDFRLIMAKQFPRSIPLPCEPDDPNAMEKLQLEIIVHSKIITHESALLSQMFQDRNRDEFQHYPDRGAMRLEKDLVGSMLVLLAIVHRDTQYLVQSNLSTSEFISLLEHAEKYGLSRHLVPHLGGWMPNESGRKLFVSGGDIVRLAWAAREIGSGDIYREEIIKLAILIPLTGDPSPNVERDDYNKFYAKILEDADKFRDYAMLAIRERLLEHRNNASNSQGCVIAWATKEDRQRCNSMITESWKEAINSVGDGFDSFIKDDRKENEPVKCSEYSGHILRILETMCNTICRHESCDPFRKMQEISGDSLWPQLDDTEADDTEA
ncbi:hypothetical protein CSPX01_08745 [Colletotrichum filicis]|nr:hypothetical protein CSPX01_08745 [Colletotrichum filicis]